MDFTLKNDVTRETRTVSWKWHSLFCKMMWRATSWCPRGLDMRAWMKACWCFTMWMVVQKRHKAYWQRKYKHAWSGQTSYNWTQSKTNLHHILNHLSLKIKDSLRTWHNLKQFKTSILTLIVGKPCCQHWTWSIVGPFHWMSVSPSLTRRLQGSPVISYVIPIRKHDIKQKNFPNWERIQNELILTCLCLSHFIRSSSFSAYASLFICYWPSTQKNICWAHPPNSMYHHVETCRNVFHFQWKDV